MKQYATLEKGNLDKLSLLTGIPAELLWNTLSPDHDPTIVKGLIVVMKRRGETPPNSHYRMDAVLKAIAEIKKTSTPKKEARKAAHRIIDRRSRQKARLRQKAIRIVAEIETYRSLLDEIRANPLQVKFLWQPTVADDLRKTRRDAAQARMDIQAEKLAKRAYETEPIPANGIEPVPFGIRYLGPDYKMLDQHTGRVEARTLNGEKRQMQFMEFAKLDAPWAERIKQKREAVAALRRRKKLTMFFKGDRVHHQEHGEGTIHAPFVDRAHVIFDNEPLSIVMIMNVELKILK